MNLQCRHIVCMGKQNVNTTTKERKIPKSNKYQTLTNTKQKHKTKELAHIYQHINTTIFNI